MPDGAEGQPRTEAGRLNDVVEEAGALLRQVLSTGRNKNKDAGKNTNKGSRKSRKKGKRQLSTRS